MVRRRFRNVLRRCVWALQPTFSLSSLSSNTVTSETATSAIGSATATATTTTTTTTAAAPMPPSTASATTTTTQQVAIPQRRFFPEIILHIGQFLDGPSLFTCLQVCREWYDLLYQFIWRKITKNQVSSPSFPLRPSAFGPTLLCIRPRSFKPRTMKMDPDSFIDYLKKTRSFEWCDSPTDSPQCSKWRKPQLIPGRSQSSPFSPALEALALMPYLVRLTLVMEVHPHLRSGLLAILSPQRLPSLRVLVLNFSPCQHLFPIFQLYPLFSILEELDLRGTWYCTTDSSNHHDHYHHHQAGSSPTFTPAPTTTSPRPPTAITPGVLWKLKKLTVEWTIPDILCNCAALEYLSLKCWVATQSEVWRAFRRRLLTLLVGLKHLKVITINRSTTTDVGMGEGEDGDVEVEGVGEEFRIREGQTMGPLSRWMKWNAATGVEDVVQVVEVIQGASDAVQTTGEAVQATGEAVQAVQVTIQMLDWTLCRILDLPEQ